MRFLFIPSIAIALFSCTHVEPSPEIEITATPIPVAPPSNSAEELARLDKVIENREARRKAVGDIIAILQAKDHESKKEWDLAVQKWLEALKIADGKVGRQAFEGWVSAYSNIMGKKATAEALSRILLAETDNGKASPYLTGSGLFRPETLQLEIEKLSSPGKATELVSANVEPYIPQEGVALEDPLLTKASVSYCATGDGFKEQWQKWIGTLPSTVLDFWRARVAECKGEYEKAIELFKVAIPRLSKGPDTATMGVYAAETLSLLYRRTDKREEASNAFIILMKAFNKPGVSHEAYGESSIDFALRRINHALWASRYRAMVKDYLNAKTFVQEAFDLIAKAYTDHPSLTNANREKLIEYKAEGYHVLAFRVAVEEKDYPNALALNRLGQQIPNLKGEWKDRFNWFSGLYQYLDGNTPDAVKRWEYMLSDLDGDDLKPQIYFWLARCYSELNQQTKSEFYLKTLLNDFPLSFYAIVAPQMAGIKVESPFETVFKNPDALEDALHKSQSDEANVFKRGKSTGPLLLRSEILVAADIRPWSALVVKDFAAEARKNYRVSSNRDAFIYASRLQHQAGDYEGAINLTETLSDGVDNFWKKHPEQVLIFYPRPYADIYERNATKYFLEREILFAISRQESKFKDNAKSGADAFGIMQLIVPTAKRFASQMELKADNLDEDLLNPEVNIRVGAHYLRFLSRYYKGEMASMFGAYNAGEYVVDTWLERRNPKDALVWLELIPFQETKNYIRSVMRNVHVYKHISQSKTKTAIRKKTVPNSKRVL